MSSLVRAETHHPLQARQRVIGSNVGPRPALPEHLTRKPAHESRLLKAAVKKHTERATAHADQLPQRG